MWADFENNLSHPNFNTLEEIFESYSLYYYPEYESDRDTIVT